jgi:hypothetical protein
MEELRVLTAEEAAGTLFYFPLQEEMRYDKGVSDQKEVPVCTVKQ